MPLIETDGLVIKTYNLAEADRIVVLLTRDHGIVRAVAKGAKRLKSRFGSGLEPFSEVRITYFQKENIELATIDRIELLRSNFSAATEPAFLQKFAYLGDVLISFLPPQDPNETIYRMLRACIDAAVEDIAAIPAVGFYFELWTLRLAGFMPDWTRCDDCGRPLEAAEDANVQADFHLLCDNCRRAAANRRLTAAQRLIVSDALRLGPKDFAASLPDVANIGHLSALLRSMLSQAAGRHIPEEVSISR